jgi:hypothetical protein
VIFVSSPSRCHIGYRHCNSFRVAERTKYAPKELLNFVAKLLSLLRFSIIMSSALRRMNPRALWKFPRPCQQAQRFFRSQHAPSRLRREIVSRLAPLSTVQLRRQSTSASNPVSSTEPAQAILPLCCPGCGAYSQTVEPNEPGFYSKTRKQTRKLLLEAQKEPLKESATQDAVSTIQKAVEEAEIAPKPHR